jgi:hypothetical protein
VDFNQASRATNVGGLAAPVKRITVLLADENRFARGEFRRILEREVDIEVVAVAKHGL